MNHAHSHSHSNTQTTLPVDPVCGMTVDPEHAAGTSELNGTTYYFCNPGCKKKFDANPVAFLGDKPAPQPEAPKGTIYTCPMHPEVRQEGPGSCPKCGMALEPELITAVEEANPELRDMSIRFWVSALFTVPLVIFAMLRHLPAAHDLLGHTAMTWGSWIELGLATPVVLWGGWPFFQRAWASIVNRHLNMFTLIGIGVAVAYLYSVLATIAPFLFPVNVGVYFEAALRFGDRVRIEMPDAGGRSIFGAIDQEVVRYQAG